MESSDDSEPTFEQQLAWSMDAEPELLPHLPALFVDLEELGARVDEVHRALTGVELGAGAKVLDLGCGKGAVAIALAERFGCTVHGVDGFAPFIAHATQRASALGLDERCVFVEGDVLDAVLDAEGYDLVAFLALGDVLGRLDQTVAALRRCVRPGGWMLVDDAYFAGPGDPGEDFIHCHDYETTLGFLRAHGDEIVAELVVDGPESAANYDAMTKAIAARAEKLAAAHPEQASALLEFAERQRAEVDLLQGPVVGALWLLRRSEA